MGFSTASDPKSGSKSKTNNRKSVTVRAETIKAATTSRTAASCTNKSKQQQHSSTNNRISGKNILEGQKRTKIGVSTVGDLRAPAAAAATKQQKQHQTEAKTDKNNTKKSNNSSANILESEKRQGWVFRARPTWPRPSLATTHFGHDLLWPRSHRLFPRSVLGICEGEDGEWKGRARKWGRWGAEGVGTQTQKKCGGQKGGSFEGWGAQTFALFFLLPPPIFILFSISGDLLVSFFLSRGVRGLPHGNLTAKTSTFEVPTEKNNQNSTRRPPVRGRKTREDPQREKKRMKMGVGRKKKREILGGPAEGGKVRLAKVGRGQSRSWPK